MPPKDTGILLCPAPHGEGRARLEPRGGGAGRGRGGRGSPGCHDRADRLPGAAPAAAGVHGRAAGLAALPGAAPRLRSLHGPAAAAAAAAGADPSPAHGLTRPVLGLFLYRCLRNCWEIKAGICHPSASPVPVG